MRSRSPYLAVILVACGSSSVPSSLKDGGDVSSNTDGGGNTNGGNPTVLGGGAAGTAGATAHTPATKTGSGGASGSAGGTAGSSGAATNSGGTTASNGGASTGGATNSAGASTGGGASTDPNASTVHLDRLHQTIDGFGAADPAFGDGSGANKDNALTDAQADLFFSPTAGVGLSLLRVGIDADGNDLAAWSNAAKAAARGARIWAAPWSAPAMWKDNGDVNNGGHLCAARGQGSCDGSHYDDWANRLVNFVTTMKMQSGVDLYAVSVQNEPDYATSYASMLYTNQEMANFVRVLGPKLAALSAHPKLMAGEFSSWDNLWGMVNAIEQDSTALSYTNIYATHQYNGTVACHGPGASACDTKRPTWETEVSGFDGFNPSIANGIGVAMWIHNALVTGNVTAWHYWWLMLQPDGTDNEALTDASGHPAKRLYAMGNFSKFVRPGFVRVDIDGVIPGGVSMTAFEQAQHVVVVAINQNASASRVSLSFVGGAAPSAMAPWVTSASDDLAPKSAIMVTNGRLSTTLQPQSITTFVSL